MLDLKQLSEVDPLKRIVEKESGEEAFSPMSPPEAYAPPCATEVPEEAMHAVLRGLIAEHRALTGELDAFEAVLSNIQVNGLRAGHELEKGLQKFFRFLDEAVVRHHLKEEKVLFPLLQTRLLEKGEHSQGAYARTAVDMMEDDHDKAIQLAAVTFNFLGLAARLPDPASRAMVLDAALEQGKALVELLRLHLFREDHVVFPMAHEHITPDEFDAMQGRLARLDAY